MVTTLEKMLLEVGELQNEETGRQEGTAVGAACRLPDRWPRAVHNRTIKTASMSWGALHNKAGTSERARAGTDVRADDRHNPSQLCATAFFRSLMITSISEPMRGRESLIAEKPAGCQRRGDNKQWTLPRRASDKIECLGEVLCRND